MNDDGGVCSHNLSNEDDDDVADDEADEIEDDYVRRWNWNGNSRSSKKKKHQRHSHSSKWMEIIFFIKKKTSYWIDYFFFFETSNFSLEVWLNLFLDELWTRWAYIRLTTSFKTFFSFKLIFLFDLKLKQRSFLNFSP